MITVNFDTAKLSGLLAELAATAKVDLGKVIKSEGGNLARNLMLIIPPTTGKGTEINPQKNPRGAGLTKKAQEQGFNAIKGDLFGGSKMAKGGSTIGLFQTIGGSKLLRPLSGKNQTVRVSLGWESSKNIVMMKRFWRPEASKGDMATFRKKYRNKYGRTGQVSQSTIGRWKVQDQMWVSQQSADAYFNILKNRVGWNKSGFAAAAIACGIRIPAWIKKHSRSSGRVSYNFGPNPFVIATASKNSIPNLQRYVDGALIAREKITLQKINRIYGNKAVNLGFAKVRGDGTIDYNK